MVYLPILRKLYIFATENKIKMIEDIIFQEKENCKCDILLQHSSGETTRLRYTNTFPLQAKEFYLKALNALIKSKPNLTPKDDWFSIVTLWFLRCNLEPPFGVGTYVETERQRIGKRIREIREGKNIEAKVLAKLSGVDAANICRIEQGKHSVGIDVLSKLANALGYKVELVKISK